MRKLVLLLAAGVLLARMPAQAQEIISSFAPLPDDPALDFGQYQHPAGGKTLTLFGGAGSGSYRGPGDLPDVIWTVGDRGPNFTCADAVSVLGLAATVACPAKPGAAAGVGRLYPRPDYSPSIYRLRLAPGGMLEVLQVLPLRQFDGTPINGLLNPQVTGTTEVPRDGAGNVLPQDASAVDAEALVRLPLFGGRFFIGEENATGLVEVAADGRILKRFVPAGSGSEYTNPPPPIAPAGYTIDDSLPALLRKRRLNRGIESLAASADFRFLYFIVQSPLDNPNPGQAVGTVRNSRNIRLYKARLTPRPAGSTIQVVGEWVYTLDTVDTLKAAGVTDANVIGDLRVSEMLLLGEGRFLIIERTDQATALYEIDLRRATNILGSKWDSPAQAPTLESIAFDALGANGIVPAAKKLRFIASSVNDGNFARKLEGLGLTQSQRLILINDDDFGVTGERVRVDVVQGAGFGRP